MSPCFLSSENKNRREQSAERVENFAHRRLGRAPTWRIRRVAIHPVFGDVDVAAAQIHRAKLVERVVDLVEFEFFIHQPACADQSFHMFETPSLDLLYSS